MLRVSSKEVKRFLGIARSTQLNRAVATSFTSISAITLLAGSNAIPTQIVVWLLSSQKHKTKKNKEMEKMTGVVEKNEACILFLSFLLNTYQVR